MVKVLFAAMAMFVSGAGMVRHDMAKVSVERENERTETNLAEYLEMGVAK